MKKISTNPMREYRRIQRLLRAEFDPFTETHCETCSTPCCRKPSRVTPMDVALAGQSPGVFDFLERDPLDIAMEHAGRRLSASAIPLAIASGDPAPEDDEPCDFLERGRCCFPDDLRPFGCTTFICEPMYRGLPDATLRRIRRLIRDLTAAHEEILRGLRRSQPAPLA